MTIDVWSLFLGFPAHWFYLCHHAILFTITNWFSSVTQSYPTLCNPIDCSTPGFSVHHQLRELAQTHVHRIGDAIQPSHPLSSPSRTFNLSQHQGLFQWVSSLYQVVKSSKLILISAIWVFQVCSSSSSLPWQFLAFCTFI